VRRACLAVFTVLLIIAMIPFVAFEAWVATVGYRVPRPRLPNDVRAPSLVREAHWIGVGEEPRTQVEQLWLGAWLRPFFQDFRKLPIRTRFTPGQSACSSLSRFFQHGPNRLSEIPITTWLSRNATTDELKDALVELSYFGRGAVGFHAAAHKYFGKSPDQLTLSETAWLVGLLQAPSRYASRPEASRKRRDFILGQLHRHGLITERELEQARSEAVRPTLDTNR
jgi:hypothetical protein